MNRPITVVLGLTFLLAVSFGVQAQALKDRAAKLKPFLPAAPAGWSNTKDEVIAQDSAMTGREIGVKRTYQKDKAVEEIVIVHIGIEPGGKPLYGARLVDDPEQAAKDKLEGVPYTLGEALGQKAATRKFRNALRSRDEHTVFHKLPNGMMAEYVVWTLPPATLEPFKAKVDYKKLGALKP